MIPWVCSRTRWRAVSARCGYSCPSAVAAEKESWVRSNEIDPDQYLGKAKKLGPEVWRSSSGLCRTDVDWQMGVNRDDLSKIGTGTVPESARSTDSLGSVVGRAAQVALAAQAAFCEL